MSASRVPSRPPRWCRPGWLVDDPSRVTPRELLLNLGPDMVEGWEGFARVVEIGGP